MDHKISLLKAAENSPVPMAILSAHDLRFIQYNQAMSAFVPIEKDADKYASFSDVFLALNEVQQTAIQSIAGTDQHFEIQEFICRSKEESQAGLRLLNCSFSSVGQQELLLVVTEVTQLAAQNFHLEDSYESLKKLVDEAPIAMALYVVPGYSVQLANTKMLALWNITGEVLNKPLHTVLLNDEWQSVFDLLSLVEQTGQIHTKEVHLQFFVNGVQRSQYVNFTCKPLFDRHGHMCAILNMATNVTTQVLTLERVISEREIARLALDAVELGIWVLDPINNIVEWDERCKVLFGFPKESIIPYEDLLMHMHNEDRERVEQTMQRSLEYGADNDYFSEFRMVDAKDKKVRWLRSKGRAYFDNQGVPYRVAGTVQDITKDVEQKAEQDKLFKLLENSYDFIGMADVEGCVVYINKAGRKLVGLAPDADVSKLNAAEFYQIKKADHNSRNLALELRKSGKWKHRTVVRNFLTNESIPVQAEYIPLNDSLGNLWGRGVILRDLRPELEAEKVLQEHKRLLEVITTEAPSALWMTDETGQNTYVNKTWLDWVGTEYQKQMGLGWLDALVEEDRERTLNKFMNCVALRAHWAIDYRVKHTDGTIRWGAAKANPRFDEHGKFIGYVGSITDITQQIITEKQLQVSNEQLNHQIKQFEFVTNVIPQVVWTTRADGEHDFFNERWYKYTGLPYEEAKDTAWWLMLHPDDEPRALKAWSYSIETGEPYDIEYRMRSKSGEYRWFLARALPLIGDDGEVVKWFGTCTDIHEQKLLERQKDDFLGIASHELKTPVTSIKAYAQVLEALLFKKGNTEEAGMISKMNRQINRLTNLIGDLLDVTKINSGQLQFNKLLFSFNEMILETVEELQRTTSTHQIICEVGDDVSVYGDRERISQVLVNMITNAIKYSPGADRVIIQTSSDKKEVKVCVKDFGIGIPEGKQDAVFEQFYRVSGDMQYTFPGLGLGLYISAEIIKREGGRIWVNSIEGEGSVFCFTIPLTVS